MKILGIGESVIDNVTVAHQQGEHAIVATQHIGGPVPSALILLSRLGIQCTIMTSLGKDKEGRIIRHVLQKEKIRLIATRQQKTKIHTILVDSVTGQREKQRQHIIHTPIAHISKQFLQQFDCILMDRHEKQAFLEVIAKKKTSTQLIIDTSTEVSQVTLAMIKHATCPILPIEALVQIDRKKGLATCLRKLQKLCAKPIVITAGNLGSILFDGKKIEIIPSLLIKSIDTTGAGDVFRGAFAFGLLQKWGIRQCIEFANLIAGLQCTKVGNVTAIPTKQEIDICKHLVIQKNPVKTAAMHTYFLQLSQSI